MQTVEYTIKTKNVPTPAFSRYTSNKIINAAGAEFRGTYSLKNIETDASDKVRTVTAKYVGRLDLLAYEEYGDPRLFWLIAEANNIIDVFSEVVEGLVVTIPPQWRGGFNELSFSSI